MLPAMLCFHRMSQAPEPRSNLKDVYTALSMSLSKSTSPRLEVSGSSSQLTTRFRCSFGEFRKTVESLKFGTAENVPSTSTDLRVGDRPIK
eukprot:s1380_g8.t1